MAPHLLCTQTYPIDNKSIVFPQTIRFWKTFNVKHAVTGKRRNLMLDWDYVNLTEYRTLVKYAKTTCPQMKAYMELQDKVQDVKRKRLPAKEEEAEIDKLIKNHWKQISQSRSTSKLV